MVSEIARIARDTGSVPLSWAGATSAQNYVNLGDALSAVMIALMAGKPVTRVPFRSDNPRLAAVGTIGQNFARGAVWFWGTGCSSRVEPRRGGGRPFTPDPAMAGTVTATRGPISAALLGGGRVGAAPYGDPVWLLPRFYRPQIEKRYELGVIVHLSDLADREVACRPDRRHRRYTVPDALSDSVRLINTVAPVSLAGMRAKLDEILACRRIVSTSLHGMVFAESYGIPCLCFPPDGQGRAGLDRLALAADAPLDLRMVDLYTGVGRRLLPVWRQPRAQPTDWSAVMDAVDRHWQPAEIDEDALINAFPLDLAPLSAPADGTIWDHPVLAAIALRHDVAALRMADRAAAAAARKAAAARRARQQRALDRWRVAATVATAPDIGGAAAPAGADA
ncbi:MAG: polysaccharide pyruvyl transferase family protein [Pseudomonadota bacterium]